MALLDSQQGWDRCVPLNICVLVCPDPILPGTRATLDLSTGTGLACTFSGKF